MLSKTAESLTDWPRPVTWIPKNWDMQNFVPGSYIFDPGTRVDRHALISPHMLQDSIVKGSKRIGKIFYIAGLCNNPILEKTVVCQDEIRRGAAAGRYAFIRVGFFGLGGLVRKNYLTWADLVSHACCAVLSSVYGKRDIIVNAPPPPLGNEPAPGTLFSVVVPFYSTSNFTTAVQTKFCDSITNLAPGTRQFVVSSTYIHRRIRFGSYPFDPIAMQEQYVLLRL